MGPKNDYWITIAYKANILGNEVRLSYEHDKYRWVSKGEFALLESMSKLQRFVKNS